jgi:hypothetical protein
MLSCCDEWERMADDVMTVSPPTPKTVDTRHCEMQFVGMIVEAKEMTDCSCLFVVACSFRLLCVKKCLGVNIFLTAPQQQARVEWYDTR